MANFTSMWKGSGSKPAPVIVTWVATGPWAGLKPPAASATGGAMPSAACSSGVAYAAMAFRLLRSRVGKLAGV